MANRFRGFLPVVVDVETGGFNPQRDALLEIAAVILDMDSQGCLYLRETHACHVKPFPGANIDQAALAVTGIDPFHPLRVSLDEAAALTKVFTPIRQAITQSGCSRAVLVGHNPIFDLNFIRASVERTGHKHNPFHDFTTFDTATLGGLAYGQTVLARAVQAAGLKWDSSKAHSALYDAERTAELFCTIVNNLTRPF